VRRVPRAAIVSRDGEAIKLKLTRAQLEGSPVYLPDGEVELAVRDSFRRYPPLANYGTGSIQVAVEDGVVTLSGNVPDEPFRRMAVACATNAEGVVEVRDRLRADGTLANEVTAALRPYRELQPSRVQVTAYLGVVILEGAVETAGHAKLAEAAARKVPGVVKVENQLRVGSDRRVAFAVEDPLILVVAGPPGSGKSTVAGHIASRLGIESVSAGALLRQAARTDREIAKLIAIGDLVPDQQVDWLISRRLVDTGPGCVLDGYPRTVPQALGLLAFLWERSWRVRRVFRLSVPEEVALERVLARGRDDDRPEVVAERLKIYHSRTEPAIELLAATRPEFGEVDNSRAPEEVDRLLEPTLRRLAAAVVVR
jgi:adenylate kinase